MSGFMMSDGLLLLRSDYLGLPFQPSDNPINGIKEILLLDGLLVTSCCSQCCLVADIGDIGT